MAKAYKDRFFLVRLSRDEKKVRLALLVIGLLLLILIGNTAYLTILSAKKEKVSVVQPAVSPSPFISLSPTISPPTPTILPQSSAPVIEHQAVREYFIPFGSGTSQASDWTDVPGLTVSLDFGNYSGIKEIHFEASVSIPTANESASVRLFNVTDQHPVWYSEITLTNGQFISSNPIIYDKGTKVYQVQMKTSLQYTANLILSRLHILLQ